MALASRSVPRFAPLAIALTALALLVACNPDTRAGDVTGTVRVDGSSTVFPIGEAVAEEFSKVSRVRVNVGFSGTGGGIEKFCRGETEFAHASREMRATEAASCAEQGRGDIVEFQVAIDALTVMVHPSNDFASCLTVQQLHDIFRNGGYSFWSEVDRSYPDEPIAGYVPGTDSGTFDYFVEAVLEGLDEEASHRGDFTASEDDNILAQGIENDTYAIGYFGFAHYQEAGQSLKSVAIDDGDGCVEATFQDALDGTYPLSRPLFIYTTGTVLREDEAARAFMDFYLENLQELVAEVGYVSLPTDIYDAQVAKLDPFLQESQDPEESGGPPASGASEEVEPFAPPGLVVGDEHPEGFRAGRVSPTRRRSS